MLMDKEIEAERYDRSAKKLLSVNASHETPLIGSETITPILRTPYQYYESYIKQLLHSNQFVLELGAGTGKHTLALVKTKAKITATDIAPHALKALEQSIKASGDEVNIKTADMESLPFDDSSFDAVVSAGSLSYGEPEFVDQEIKRVLKPGGVFICVDSLNHNPVYRFNRWVHFLRGKRTKSTLKRMPNLRRIEMIASKFKQSEIHYFGAFSFLMPLFVCFVGQEKAKKCSDFLDELFNVKRLAFKFVLVAKDL